LGEVLVITSDMHLNKANSLGIPHLAIVKQITEGGNACMVFLLFVVIYVSVGQLINILFKREITKWC